MNGPEVIFCKSKEEAIIPQQKYRANAGFDFYSPLSLDIHVGKTCWLKSGIRVAIPVGWAFMVLLKLSRASKGTKKDDDYIDDAAL